MQTFICDNIENEISQMLHYKNNPQLSCPGLTDERKRYLVCGQRGIGKEDQLIAIFKRENAPTHELLVTKVVDDTVASIQALVLNTNDILVIRNVELLTHMLEQPIVRKFALQLPLIDNYIVAISNVPFKPSAFYNQFQVKIGMTLPPQSYIESMYRHAFTTYTAHCEQQGMDIKIDLKDEDYTWLTQSSDSCTPRDVREFCTKVFYYAADSSLFGGSFTIDRELLEDTDNKLMYDISGSGILSITNRETFKAQQLFDTSLGQGVRAPPRKRAKKKE